MLFNSLEFALFFPAVCLLYFALPQRRRWILLLIASYWFYASWRLEYVFLIAGSTIIDYIVGRQMGRHEDRKGRRPWLLLSLGVNLGALFLFKYARFFTTSLNDIPFIPEMPLVDLLLPVGISFYTFQTLSYSIDVYRGARGPEKNLGIFALYVSFFPQLVAGPIERSTHLLPQFHEQHPFDRMRVVYGLRRMLWGLFKKMVIADTLALAVDPVFNDPELFHGVRALLAVYLFAFQIYCDFSAYSDIAIGSAQVLGYDLMENFRRPYHARSIADFWRRWHISLSTWFRDYVYIPLGGSRSHHLRNIWIVFLLSGLWHGAAWTFVFWGALHAFYQVVGLLTAQRRERFAEMIGLAARPRMHQMWQIFITFQLVCFAWVFFRAPSMSDAVTLIQNIVTPGVTVGSLGLWGSAFLVALVWVAVLEIVHLIEARRSLTVLLDRSSEIGRWAAYSFLFLAILLFGRFGSDEFIYFVF